MSTSPSLVCKPTHEFSQILLKVEAVQPSGSFKSRGIGNYLVKSLEQIPTDQRERVHFYSSSGGNAGLACVHAAVTLGLPASVVVPTATKAMMVVKIRAAGAKDVIQHGASWFEADTYLRQTVMVAAEQRGEIAIHVPPFDHPAIWQGAASLIHEAASQVKTAGFNVPDVIVCSVGGGGLLNGVMEGMKDVGWNDTTVLALETKGADSLNASMQAGEHVRMPSVTSEATSLGASKVSEQTYKLATMSGRVKSHVFTDAEAAMGCWRLADDDRLLVELACGVNAAVCYGGRLQKALGRAVKPDETVMIIICGGSGVTIDMLTEWRHRFGSEVEAADAQEQKIVPSALSGPSMAQ